MCSFGVLDWKWIQNDLLIQGPRLASSLYFQPWICCCGRNFLTKRPVEFPTEGALPLDRNIFAWRAFWHREGKEFDLCLWSTQVQWTVLWMLSWGDYSWLSLLKGTHAESTDSLDNLSLRALSFLGQGHRCLHVYIYIRETQQRHRNECSAFLEALLYVSSQTRPATPGLRPEKKFSFGLECNVVFVAHHQFCGDRSVRFAVAFFVRSWINLGSGCILWSPKGDESDLGERLYSSFVDQKKLIYFGCDVRF